MCERKEREKGERVREKIEREDDRDYGPCWVVTQFKGGSDTGNRIRI